MVLKTDSLTRSRWGRALLGFIGVAAFVMLWKYAQSAGWAAPGTIPDPFSLPQALADEWTSGRLLPAVLSSLIHYSWGLAIGTFLGFMVGTLTASSLLLDALHAWLARILRPIPPLAWVVFAIAWFKVSHAGAAFVIAIGVFWVNYFATYSAVRNVDPRFYELANAFGQNGHLRQALQVTLPGAATGIFSGIRTGIGQAWMTLIAAELLGVPGMGQEMNSAAGVGAYNVVVVYMLVISLVYTLSDTLFGLIEKRVLKWRPS
ncbi:ABC transporter permease [Marinomonas spartinae]|uniref:ABC transporter permease n=1 Tax=Marinomonas spartinae TaxID=1792290 RepID=UPI0018F195D2|nr:ABC transporter permease [Marinomonas spartinae]MBJ7555967.1 ABC transporter permease [Marinomonas spartinae]